MYQNDTPPSQSETTVSDSRDRRPVAVLGAMSEEIELLLGELDGRSDEPHPGVVLHRGMLAGREVLLAYSGVGKVNAAAAAQTLALSGAGSLIFTGVAGALDDSLAVGDLVVGVDAVQYDVDVTGLGYSPAQVPGEPVAWPCDPRLVELAYAAALKISGARAVKGRIASGDTFVAAGDRAADLRRRFGATCVEMEGAAVAQVCSRAGIPFVIVRSVSDSADGDAEVSFREFTITASRQAKSVVRSMLAALVGEER